MLATLNDILPAARREGRAVGGFNIGNYATLLAVLRAAENTGQPVIVQLYNRLIDAGHGEPLAAATRVLAMKMKTPVVLHLDHGSNLQQIERALAAGFTSVMLDASQQPMRENSALVKEAAAMARAAGATLEAEIGHVPMGGSDLALTTPDEARAFHDATGVDALAVSIGTAHGFYKTEPHIDTARARAIADAVPIPLVLHGGSGTPPAAMRQVIQSGFAKVNIATEFQFDYQQNLRAHLNEVGDRFVAVDLLEAPVVEQSTAFIERQIRFLAGLHEPAQPGDAL